MLDATAAATSELLIEADLDAAIQRGLTYLGLATGVDRVYYFENSYDADGHGFMSQRFEWNSDTSSPQINNPDLQNVPFDATPEFIEAIRSDESFVAHVADLADTSLKEMLAAQEIISILILPIHAHGRFAGFVGFDDCVQRREWSESEYSILKAFSVSLSSAVERRETQEELAAAKEAAEAANRAKSQFLANMSHEMRTPLNAILGITQFLEQSATTRLTERESEGLKLVSESGKRLLSLITDILDLSNIEADRLSLVNKPFVVRETIERLRLTAESIAAHYATTATLTVWVSADVSEVIVGDEGRIFEVASNLVGNALKFTPEGTIYLSVTQTAAASGDVLTVAVTDTGIGIPNGELDRAFESFSQADPSDRRAFSGAGLGLALSRKLARLMGGDVTLESSEGRGTVARLVIPVSCHLSGDAA